MTARLRLLLAAVLALAARGAVLAAFAGHPLLRPKGGLDTGVYVDLARRIAAGDVFLRSLPSPFFVSPLYAWFLGAVFALSGGSLLAAQIIQIILGAVAVWLAGDMAQRAFGERAAVPAAALLAFSGVVAFHEAVLIQAALDPFLTALTLWLLYRALEERPAFGRFLLAGLALGLFALNRPNVLPWAAVVVAGLVASRGLRSGSFLAASFLLGAGLAIAPASLRNAVVGGEPVLISSHGGLNLLIGNGPGADGTYRWLDGITPAIAGQASDARKVAEAEAGHALSTRAVSAHFARKAWAWMTADPAAALRLLLRKLWYVFSGDEAPLNFSYPWYRQKSLALRLLAVGPGLLVPLGGAGLALLLVYGGRLPRKDLLVWASFTPAYALLVALFFVATRYRIPLFVPLSVLGGGAIVALIDAVRLRQTRELLLAASVALPLGALAFWPTGLYDGAADEETEWILHLIQTGEAAEAAQRVTILSTTHPEPAVFWSRVSQALGAAGRLSEAISASERALAPDPQRTDARKALAELHQRRGLSRMLAGDIEPALADLEAAAALDPMDPVARLNLAAVLAQRGDTRRARALAAEALALRPGYEKAQALLRALEAVRK